MESVKPAFLAERYKGDCSLACQVLISGVLDGLKFMKDSLPHALYFNFNIFFFPMTVLKYADVSCEVVMKSYWPDNNQEP